jgi:hypothetical protein
LLPGGDDLSLQSNLSGALGTPDRREYAVQFRRHCHELIVAAYSRIRSEEHSESAEDFITQRLKETIQAAQREGALPKWADRYFVTDQAPVSVPNRIGKERPKIDIEIESTECRSRPVYHFEAKRLRIDDSHSVSAYLGPAGLGCFLAELYGRAGDEGGMLGYVQSETPEHWAGTIQGKVQRDPKENHQLTDDGFWTAARLIPALNHTYVTRHRRPTLGNITIYHTLLDFRPGGNPV